MNQKAKFKDTKPIQKKFTPSRNSYYLNTQQNPGINKQKSEA